MAQQPADASPEAQGRDDASLDEQTLEDRASRFEDAVPDAEANDARDELSDAPEPIDATIDAGGSVLDAARSDAAVVPDATGVRDASIDATREAGTPSDAGADGAVAPTRVQGLLGRVGPDDNDSTTVGANPYGVPDLFLDCAAGDDASTGRTAASPLRTLDRLNGVSGALLQPGSRVFLKRGSICRGALSIGVSGTEARPVEVRAWGVGSAPVLSGSIEATGWTRHAGSIWKANVGRDRDVRYVYANGAVQTLARLPNRASSGATVWATVDDMNRNADNATSYLLDGALPSSATMNLTGARVFYRHSNFAWMQAPVTAHSGQTLTLATGPNSQCYAPHCTNSIYPAAGWGYLVENALSLLDAPGEWFYDRASGDLYFWPPSGAAVTSMRVEAAVVSEGLTLFEKSYVQVRNVVFQHYTQRPVQLAESRSSPGRIAGLVLEQIEVRDSWQGLAVATDDTDAARGVVVRRSHFHDLYNVGWFVGGFGHRFEGNVLERVGLSPELGGDASLWAYFGVRTVFGASIFRRNWIRDIAYIGFNQHGDGEVSENLIERASIRLNDGCGLCIDEASAAFAARRNIVRDVHGNIDGVPSSFVHALAIGSGISTGDRSTVGATIEENVVSDFANGGITLDNNFLSRAIVVRRNTVFSTRPVDGASGLKFMDQSVGVGGTCTSAGYGCFVANFDHQISENAVYMLETPAPALSFAQVLTNGASAQARYGAFWGNHFFQSRRRDSVVERRFWGGLLPNDLAEVRANPDGTNVVATVFAQPNATMPVGTHATGDNATVSSPMTVSGITWWRVSFATAPTTGWIQDYQLALAPKTVAEWQTYAMQPPAGRAANTAGYVTAVSAELPQIYVNDLPANEAGVQAPRVVTVGAGRCTRDRAPLPTTVTLARFADVVVAELCARQP